MHADSLPGYFMYLIYSLQQPYKECNYGFTDEEMKIQRLDYMLLQSCMVTKQQNLYMSLNLTPKIMLFIGWPTLPTLDLD